METEGYTPNKMYGKLNIEEFICHVCNTKSIEDEIHVCVHFKLMGATTKLLIDEVKSNLKSETLPNFKKNKD